jgi:hypothetical protein
MSRRNNRAKIEAVQFADASERGRDILLLGLKLRFVPDMLPRTSAALADVGAGWSLTDGRGSQQTNQFADSISVFRFNEMRCHSISGRRTGDHDGLPLDAADTVGTVRKRVNL